jgi:hypothetical protein
VRRSWIARALAGGGARTHFGPMRTPPPVHQPEDRGETGYQSTLLDRHGPDVMLRVRAAAIGGAAVVGSLPVFMGAMAIKDVHGLKNLGSALVLALLTGWFVWRMTLGTADAAGALTRAATLPSGNSTPYEEQFSYQESLAIRGDVAGALASYEAVIAERPGAAAPRLRAAELYATQGADPRRAAELFREVRDLPGLPLREAVYASSRLVDLYDGPLAEPGRALVELRRIVERYPGTPTAVHAREAIPRLKARLASDQSGG